RGTQPSVGAHTFAFICLILAELVRAYSSRSERHSVFSLGFFSNATLNKAILLSLGLTLAVVYLPFMNDPFYTIPLQLRDWGVILTLVLIPFAAGEIFKKLYHRSGKKRKAA
ncbi:MAG: cation-translocating P-type ATPase C-terminal domain-containing protein, partial [Eubacteriales bacterium]|nr:cation-translocating P-type ATPase C-terminal domain-containing protein [Eubacteriales bacterium]